VPTYQYACTECGHDLEAVQSFTDDALTECPVCHGRLRKVFGAVGIVFKGSGFYRNDSRDKKAGDTPAKVDAKADTTKGDAKKSDAPSDKPSSGTGKDSGSAKPAAASPSSGSSSGSSSTKGSAA
jgi:putative FmdB family regulatory protein